MGTTLLSLLLTPAYIRFLGLEAFGFVGIFVTLQMLANVFDLGMSATLMRQVARLSLSAKKAAEARDMTRSLETIYWSIGVFLGVIILLAAPFLARHWIHSNHLTSNDVRQAISLMAIAIFVQWPASFYLSGLIGLQRQTLGNYINLGSAVIRGGGTLLTLWVSPTIKVFLVWQILAGLTQTALSATALWKVLPPAPVRSRFRPQLLKALLPLAANINAVSVTVLLFQHADKIILSRILTIEEFAYYTLAWLIANAAVIPFSAVWEAYSPRLSQLVAQNNSSELTCLFHEFAQFAGWVMFPVASLVILFPGEVILLWTRNPSVTFGAQSATWMLTLAMVVNYAVAGTLDLLQVACGWVRPSLYSRVIALVVCGPAMVLLTVKYKAIGAAVGWLIIYGSYLISSPYFVFSRLLSGEKWRWYLKDLGLPFMVSILISYIWRVIIPLPQARTLLFLYLSGALIVSSVSVAAAMRSTRQLITGSVGTILRQRLRLKPAA
jgi:O-antigen/teichoic acid export membrane protein